jgi:pectinesterase
VLTRIGIVFVILLSIVTTLLYGQDTAPIEYVVDKNDPKAFQTIQAAIDQCKVFSDKRIYIYIKSGVYKEKLVIHSHTIRISLIGESSENTIITYDDYSGKGDINTFTSYTVKILGDEFQAENITFENNAPMLGQAVAVHVEADKVSFRECRFSGNQDTIFAGGKGRQYFSSCYIEGTTDFIFGDATAVFDLCTIHSKKNSYITAASTPKERDFGFVFIHCELTAAPDVTRVYLGRPWRNYAKVVFFNCELDKHIVPEGWHNWNKPEAEKTVVYAEYNSRGDGANPKNRVSWSRQLTEKELSEFNLDKIFAYEDRWIPE